MDVGAPSNFERLIALPPELRDVRVERVDDDAIRARIVAEYARERLCLVPAHGDRGRGLCAPARAGARRERPWIAAATAHPYKFAEIVEPLIGRRIEPPPALAAILEREPQQESGSDATSQRWWRRKLCTARTQSPP